MGELPFCMSSHSAPRLLVRARAVHSRSQRGAVYRFFRGLPPINSQLQQMLRRRVDGGHIAAFCRFHNSGKVNSWLFSPHMVIMMILTQFVNHVSGYKNQRRPYTA